MFFGGVCVFVSARPRLQRANRPAVFFLDGGSTCNTFCATRLCFWIRGAPRFQRGARVGVRVFVTLLTNKPPGQVEPAPHTRHGPGTVHRPP